MFGIGFKLFAIGIGLVWLAYLVAGVFRKARALDRRVARYKAEQEERDRSGIAEDPYVALAGLYAKDAENSPRPPRGGAAR